MSIRTSPSTPHTDYFPPPKSAVPGLRWLARMADDSRELVRFWPVVANMVMQDLRVRYQRSVLGFIWTLLNPILMLATLTVVFANLMDQSSRWQDYSIYLFAGMVPWSLLAASLNDCAFCIIQNESLIRKIYLPKLVFPITRVLINLVTFVLSMGALFLLLVPLGAKFTVPMLLLPVVVLLYTTFTLGLGLLISILNTFYRDCSHLVSVFLQAWYFATPILYFADRFEDRPWVLWMNPVYPFIRLFQILIRDGEWPDLVTMLAAVGIAVATLGAGYVSFKTNEDKLVFRL